MGKKGDGVMRQDGFVITVASEIMAILCLATDIKDLQERLSRIIVAYNVDNEPVTAGELKCVGAMTVAFEGCDQTKSDPDIRAYTSTCTRWSICEYRTWL